MRHAVSTGVALVRASHPGPSAVVTLAAGALALAAGYGTGGLVAVLLAVLAGQLSVGWLNDYLDAERDTRVGRRDKPVASGAVLGRTVVIAAVGAAVTCVLLSLLLGLLSGLVHLVAVGSAWSYNLGLKATTASVLPYAVSFGLLPAFVVLGGPAGSYPPIWLILSGALLGAGAHFANVLPDLAEDEVTGIRGLPHRIGAAGSRIVTVVLLLTVSAVLTISPAGTPTVLGATAFATAVIVLATGFALGRRSGSRALFRAVLIVALVDVVLLVLTIRFSLLV